MRKDALIELASRHDTPKTRLLKKWLFEEEWFASMPEDSEIHFDEFIAYSMENGVMFEPTGLMADAADHDLWTHFMTGNRVEAEEEKEEKVDVQEEKNVWDMAVPAILPPYDVSRVAEFMALVRNKDRLGAFQLANSEILDGNDWYIDFWFFCMLNDVKIRNQPASFFGFNIPDSPDARTPRDWCLKGWMHFFGIHPETENRGEARQCFQEAASLGDVPAKRQLALLLGHEIGVARDPVRARTLFEETVGAGDILSLDSLAYMLVKGQGGIADPVLARTLIDELDASLHGFASVIGNKNISDVYQLGIGGPSDIPAAVFWMNNAAVFGRALRDRYDTDDLTYLLNGLGDNQVPILLDRFWPVLVSGKCILHPCTMKWFHKRQDQVLDWVKDEENHGNDVQALISAMSPEHPLGDLFTRQSKNRIREIMKETMEKEMCLFRLFRSKREKSKIVAVQLTRPLLGMFDNHPSGLSLKEHVELDRCSIM